MDLAPRAGLQDGIEHDPKYILGRRLLLALFDPLNELPCHVIHALFGNVEDKVALGRIVVIQGPLAYLDRRRDVREADIGNTAFLDETRRGKENFFPVDLCRLLFFSTHDKRIIRPPPWGVNNRVPRPVRLAETGGI